MTVAASIEPPSGDAIEAMCWQTHASVLPDAPAFSSRTQVVVSGITGVGDAESTQTVYSTIVALLLLGVVLVALAIWVFRRTRPEPELLAPLEVMQTRGWRKLDPAAQRRLLDDARPAEAAPLRREASEPTVDSSFAIVAPVSSFDDLSDREEKSEGGGDTADLGRSGIDESTQEGDPERDETDPVERTDTIPETTVDGDSDHEDPETTDTEVADVEVADVENADADTGMPAEEVADVDGEVSDDADDHDDVLEAPAVGAAPVAGAAPGVRAPDVVVIDTGPSADEYSGNGVIAATEPAAAEPEPGPAELPAPRLIDPLLRPPRR